jgi:hypothetical protein
VDFATGLPRKVQRLNAALMAAAALISSLVNRWAQIASATLGLGGRASLKHRENWADGFFELIAPFLAKAKYLIII